MNYSKDVKLIPSYRYVLPIVHILTITIALANILQYNLKLNTFTI